jgi:hypothetical protein
VEIFERAVEALGKGEKIILTEHESEALDL